MCVWQDDPIVHHMAAKAIENISTAVSGPSHHLLTTEMGSALWYLFTHSNVEAVRVTAISVSSHALKQFFKLYVQLYVQDHKVEAGKNAWMLELLELL